MKIHRVPQKGRRQTLDGNSVKSDFEHRLTFSLSDKFVVKWFLVTTLLQIY